MQQLQEELDRISLGGRGSGSAASTPGQRAKRSTSRKTRKKTKKGKRSAASPAPFFDSGARTVAVAESYDMVSLSSEDVSDRPSSPSSSSRFDSAFGSLHSQTDNDSLLSLPRSHPPPLERATPTASPPPLAHSGAGATSYNAHVPVSRKSYNGNKMVVEATVEQYFSPQLEMPALVNPPHPVHTQPSPTEPEGTHPEEPHCVSVLGTTVRLRQREHKPKVHRQLTSEDMKKHLEWLQTSQSRHPQSATAPAEEEVLIVSEKDGNDLQSESSSSTIVGETEPGSQAAALEAPQVRDDDGHLKKYGSSWVRVKPPAQHHLPPGSRTTRTKYSPPSQPKETKTDKGSALSTRFYQDNLTPQSSPQVPRRYLPSSRTNRPQQYNMTQADSANPDEEERRQPPRRSASILQRLRRRHGSFRRYGRPRRRTPVRRSFSDRFVYHLKKRWVDYEEDLCPVSNPSLLRPIGRLLRTHAGRLHIIELHKPPNGHFGIYITQGAEQKIFISRFANVTAEKFYTGLLTPGDEIVSINGQEIRDKSLDYVYGILSQLNSVVLSLVPVSAHRNW